MFVNAAGSHPDEASVKHMGMVWDLCVALWGNMPEFKDMGKYIHVVFYSIIGILFIFYLFLTSFDFNSTCKYVSNVCKKVGTTIDK